MTSSTALLTIRAWCEDGSEHPLRAEIRLTNDVALGFQHALTVADAERDLREKIRVVQGITDALGLRLLWTATHPFSLWRERSFGILLVNWTVAWRRRLPGSIPSWEVIQPLHRERDTG